MATIVSLVIAITAKTDGLEAGAAKAAREASNLQKKLDAIPGNALQRFIGAGAIMAAFASATRAAGDAWHQYITADRSTEFKAQNAALDAQIKLIDDVSSALRSIPIAGAIGGFIADAFDDSSASLADFIRKREHLVEITRLQAQAEKLWQAARRQFELADADSPAERSAVKLANDLEQIHEKYKALAAEAAKATDDRKEYLRLLNVINEAEAMEAEAIRLRSEAEAASAGQELLDGLREQVNTFGMASEQIAIYKAQLAGVAPEILAQAQAMRQQLEAMREQQKLMEEGKRIFESTRSPLERYRLELQHLQELLDAGAIDMDTFNRAVKQAGDALRSASGGTRSIANPAAVEQRFTLGAPGNAKTFNPFADLEKESKTANQEAKDRKRLLQDSLTVQRTIAERLDFTTLDF